MSSLSSLKTIVLRKNEERRILAGHPWIFSNEVRETHGTPGPGDVVEVRTAGGKPLGTGFYHPHSLIAVRLLSREVEEIDENFLRQRLLSAAALRERLFPGSQVYRVVHGEADFLPGLVVDRFGDYLALQTFAYGMDLRLPMLCDLLEDRFHPAGIIERNESPTRILEGLPFRKGILRGSAGTTTYTDNGVRLTVDLMSGQKTGYFLDQRVNRLLIRGFSPGARVLDCFCNDGGFALHAAQAGASAVLGIDSSGEAIERARANALENGLSAVQFEERDVFSALKMMAERGDSYDVIVLDPPSFTKSRKNVATAKKGYRELHHLAFRLLGPGGILLTASCSHHILPETFLAVIHETAVKDGRAIQLLDWRGAAPDHPTLPGVPETGYLKFGVFRVL